MHPGYIFISFLFHFCLPQLVFAPFLAPVIPGDAFLFSKESGRTCLQRKHAALWHEVVMKGPSILRFLCFAIRSTHQMLEKLQANFFFFFVAVALPVIATKKNTRKIYNAIVYKPLPLRCLKFNGAIFFDDKEGQIPPTTCCHSLSLEGSVCAH